ncbi:MAG: glycosyltransferase family 4 protein [Methylococcales bacterium]
MALNILFVIPSLRRAGAETQFVELINGMDNATFNKHLLCFEKELDLLPRLDRSNVKFIHHPRSYKFDFSMVSSISRIIDDNDIDLVFCSLRLSLLMGWLGVKKSDKKPHMVYAIHSTINQVLKTEIFDRFIYQWLMRNCEKILFVCNNQKRYWESKYSFLKNKSVAIHNGVDTEIFNPQNFTANAIEFKNNNNIPEDSIVLTSVAGFRPEKGHIILLQSFMSLLKNRPNCYLLLAGDGQERLSIEAFIESHGLENNVKLLGNVEKIQDVLAASDMTILASTAVETFSMAMLESMAMGVPVVATDIGGANEAIFPSKTGYLIEPGSPESLLQGITSLLNLYDAGNKEGIAQQCRNMVEDNFSKTQMIDKTEDTLLNVIN